MSNNEEKCSSDYGESQEPLLEDSMFERQRKPWFPNFWARVSFAILLLYTVVSVPILVISGRNQMPRPYSPASNVVSYRREPLYFGEDPKFTGDPDDVDEAWDKLLEPLNIRTSYEEQVKAHSKITPEIVQPAEGGYVSVLSVYHELHCLDTLRRNLYIERYYSNVSEAQRKNNAIHMTHCIDTIRRSLMCKADTAIYTAYWIGNHTAIPSKELRSGSDSICVNWEALDTWARKRLLPRNVYKVKPGPFEQKHD